MKPSFQTSKPLDAVQIQKRNGTLFWGLYFFHLNTVDGYMECLIADISDVYDELRLRKQAEAALQNSEERLRLALMNLFSTKARNNNVIINLSNRYG
ncbi:hypothetical protein H6G96_22490 [Nostoc sp. FACHB-892]|uniref:hypothetical protein n=1 Tax=Nostoc sp. FACHB-892 TaxID=2692843 RepID=UPI001687BCD5|nr:hypothetical protein [Nostoc sp. FACHB-892]MBD2729009.1 hypothetical protein [Nostoc sp. FACHB-892]